MAAKKSTPQKKSMSFAWTTTFYDKFEADDIADALNVLIEERAEYVTSDEIVIAAKKRESPLHELFTWSDPEAAEKWRRKEAKAVVRHLVAAENGEATHTRAFYYVPNEKHGGKRTLLSTRSAMTRPDTAAFLIEQRYKQLMRSVMYLEQVTGKSPGLERLKHSAKAVRARAKRDLMVATR